MTHKRVLEVGTGTGLMSGMLSRYCDAVVSLDNDDGVIESARHSTGNIASKVTFVGGDAFAMPFADKSFDAAFSQGLFEHFSDEDMLGLAREQLRVAHAAVISVPSFFYPHIGKLGPGLVGNERLKRLDFWRELFSEFHVEVATYYSDHKILTIGGVTLPWPAQILIELRAKEMAVAA
jgi:SAM-dependent methyltransferase